jgi:hypothetical protein
MGEHGVVEELMMQEAVLILLKLEAQLCAG